MASLTLSWPDGTSVNYDKIATETQAKKTQKEETRPKQEEEAAEARPTHKVWRGKYDWDADKRKWQEVWEPVPLHWMEEKDEYRRRVKFVRAQEQAKEDKKTAAHQKECAKECARVAKLLARWVQSNKEKAQEE